MEAVIFVGIQATGKSTFYKDRFSDTHIRLNLDMLKTRHREKILLNACLASKQPFVIDNTNPSAEERTGYIRAAKEAQFRVVGYYFRSQAKESLERNSARDQSRTVPERAVLGTYNRLELPNKEEGFDELFYVTIDQDRGFEVQEWSDEV